MERLGLRGWELAVAAACVLMIAQAALGEGAAAQSGDASAAVAFDVVSIKPVDPNAKITFVGLQYTPDGIQAGHVTVSMLIRGAYGGFMKVPDDGVTGLPDWAKTESFDMKAKMSPEQAAEFAKLSKDDQEERREGMLRSLLEDRFKLKVHREPKQIPDYELVVAKGGTKLKEGGAPDPNAPKDKDGNPISGSFLMMQGIGHVRAQMISMEQLANFLGQGPVGVGRMVEDKTGLTGKYSFTLNWTPDPGLGSGTIGGIPAPPPSSASPAAAPDDSLPSLFTALQEQLGLKLQPGAGTIDLVVVDHVEKPTED